MIRRLREIRYLALILATSFVLFQGRGWSADHEYRLKIGDRLILSVYGEENTKRDVFVGPTGSIGYLFIPSIRAEGKTISDLRTDLTEQLKTYYRFPLLSITASEFLGDHYTIVGEVKIPGKKPLLGNATLLTALSIAGGFNNRLFRTQTIDTVDLEHSFLARNGEYVPIDFARLVYQGDMSQNIPLKSGDYIYLATYVMPRVYILGEVRRNTTIYYLDTMSLAEALAEAGGLNLRASSRVVVIRGALACPTTFLIDVNRLQKAKACNFWLEPGDIVYVPSMKLTYLKEIIQGGISSFISTLANVAGTNTFLEITPKAKNTNVISPVPVVGGLSGTTQQVIATSAPAVGG